VAGDDRGKRKPANDRTIYWTLSFYIPQEKLKPFAPGIPYKAHAFAAELREAAKRNEAQAGDPSAGYVDPATENLRRAIDPLFNDVADRSRLGMIDDFLFAGLPARDVILTLPETIEWMTEGKTFVVDLSGDAGLRERKFDFRSFWYVHGNGSLSWHAGFSHNYDEELKHELKGGTPVSYYLMSLLQKLAWPKEFDPLRGRDCPDGDCTTDGLVRIKVEDQFFWEFVKARFDEDAGHRLPQIFGPFGWRSTDADGRDARFGNLIESPESIEVPGLAHPDSRSCFFIHDKQFFELIQPKKGGTLTGRGSRVLDRNFEGYPDLIESVPVENGKRLLGPEYWRQVYATDAGIKSRASASAAPMRRAPEENAADLPDAGARLTYLYLAGFNQNIVDFMNQEASEILDSLDPIYPKSEEQEKEGFFIRYANPRSMITYVPRSRTLEVGNDFIGTCPYAFLIHALSLHNEVLTRAQEKETFGAIETIIDLIDQSRVKEEAGPDSVNDKGKGHNGANAKHRAELLNEAEALINRTRIDAFRKFDQHRYVNPFRYDTERDVFDEMEQLRGTSRLTKAYKAALDALDEQLRDVLRIRKESEDDESAARERRMSYIFSFLGFTGITGLILSTDDFLRQHASWLGKIMPHPEGVTLALIYWLVPAAIIFMIIRMFGPARR
jgi:hypothetical protein